MSENRDETALSQYLSDSFCLVADSHQGSRVRLANSLIKLGAKPGQVRVAGGYHEAKQEVATSFPRVILCDYELGSRSGLDLLQEQREKRPYTRDGIFVLVTANSSQAAVARAAEEDVDTYVLKPYTMEILKRALTIAALQKVFPGEYLTLIEEGKTLLFSGKFSEASKLFAKARELSSKPTLACFYLGQTEVMREAFEDASQTYRVGLSYNKIHYKCLIGLHELLMKRGQHDEAYDIFKRITKTYPANPKRLSTALKLALLTKNYSDIDGYYRIFLHIDDRTEELVRGICAALIVTGKYYLSTEHKSRGLDFLNKAVVSCAGRPRFIRYAIEGLVENKMVDRAKELLGRFPSDLQSGEDFLTSEYLVESGAKGPAQVLHHGRRLIKEGIRNVAIYRTMIEGCLEAGFGDSAIHLYQCAAREWPELRGHFAGRIDPAVLG